jgi:iron complex outermembrane receptor protein
LQVDGSRSDYRLDTPTAGFAFTNFIFGAPDASNDNLQPFSFMRDSRNDAGIRLTWNANQYLTLRTGAKYVQNQESSLFILNELFSPAGGYSQFVNHQVNFDVETVDGFAYGDLKFATGPVTHKITAGVGANSYYASQPLDASLKITAGGFNFFNPSVNAAASQAELHTLNSMPAPGQAAQAAAGKQYWLSRMIGDEINITDQWSVIAGVNYATVGSIGQGGGKELSSTRKSAFSPSGSLIFKPIPNLSFYATYIQGLEAGVIAGTTGSGPLGVLPISNPGPQPATIDEQYEVGSKVRLGDLLATVSLFSIIKSSDALVPNPGGTSYMETDAGKERHQGAEFDLSGKATDNLTLFGGLTVFDAKIISQPAAPAQVGQQPAGVSPMMAKMYAEYAIDAVPGLVVTGGIQYYDRQAVSVRSTTSAAVGHIPDYAVVNLGARYTTALYGKETIFRLNVYNLANSNYWATAGGGVTVEGAPLTMMASAEVKFK